MPTVKPEGNGVQSAANLSIPDPAAPPKAESRSRPRFVVAKTEILVYRIPIVGITPLVTNPYPAKVMKEFEEERARDNEVDERKIGGNKGKKKALPPRNYGEEYQASIYHLDDGHGCGMPAIAFKRAIADACRIVGNIDPKDANMILFVRGEYQSGGTSCVKIFGEPHVRRDTVKLQGRNRPPDNRFRAEYFPWETVLEIEFDSSFIKLRSVINLIERAGYHCGVGEMRPTAPLKPNDFGRWRLMSPEEIAQFEARAAAPAKPDRKKGR